MQPRRTARPRSARDLRVCDTLARQRWQGPRPEPIADVPLPLDADDDIPLARVRLAAVAVVDPRGATAAVEHFGVFLDESAVRWVTVPLA